MTVGMHGLIRPTFLRGDPGYAGSFRIVIPAPVAQQRVRRRGPSQVSVEFSLWGRAVRDMRMFGWVPVFAGMTAW